MDTSRPYAYMNRAGAGRGTLRRGIKTEKRGEGQRVRSGAGCYCGGGGVSSEAVGAASTVWGAGGAAPCARAGGRAVLVAY